MRKISNFLRTSKWQVPLDSLEYPDLALDLALAILPPGIHDAV
jgi:hypothetical protein